jgi:hypothetical protein
MLQKALNYYLDATSWERYQYSSDSPAARFDLNRF